MRLHKQNFRRLVETQGLVEETGEVASETGGRPARLVRFRREVLVERPAPGVRLAPLEVSHCWSGLCVDTNLYSRLA